MKVQKSKSLLVVGEGDFSFSLSLAKAFGSTTNITATSLDIREELGRNYNNGKANVEELERLGCTVIRSVNLHSMPSHFCRYDKIVFNFPHAGKHQEVVTRFMESAKEMVKDEDGEIHVTHKTIYPFNELDIKTLAEEKGLHLIKKQMQFKNWIFPNKESNFDSSFPNIGSLVTFMFKK